MRAYVIEGIGAFFLVLVYGMAYAALAPLAALAIGASLMALVYVAAPLSGGHFNPAITLAARIRGWVSWRQVGGYLLAQLLGSLAAAALVPLLVLDAAFVYVVTPDAVVPMLQALLVELLFSYFLALVMLLLSGGPGLRGHAALGLAVGLVYMTALLVGKNVSGGAFNPLVGLSPNLLEQVFAPMWVYAAGPLLGGALAGFTVNYLRRAEQPAATVSSTSSESS